MNRTLEDRLAQLYGRYGYAPWKMNRFEEYDLYLRNRDFLQSDRVITFSGPDGRLLAMKPDITLSIIKNPPEAPGTVRKVHYREAVYRLDRDTGEFREISQTGLECVGDVGFYETAEVTCLAAMSLRELGGRTILSLSHVGLIHEALDGSGLTGAARKQALDCLGQKREQELRQLCAGESQLLTLLRARTVSDLAALPDTPARRELEQIVGILDRRGLGDGVRLDFSQGTDMKYYSGLVFKGYAEGIPAGVLTGGRYDGLLKAMKKDARAIGFAVYLDQLERRGREEPEFDVDTLLLTGGAEPALVLEAIEALGGTVLAAGQPPKDRTWRRLAKLVNGEVQILERHD